LKNSLTSPRQAIESPDDRSGSPRAVRCHGERPAALHPGRRPLPRAGGL